MVAKYEDGTDNKELVMATVARVTGHRAEELTEDMLLDSDIGIDSIKMVEILNALVAVLPEESRDFTDRDALMQRLTEVSTLGDLFDAFRDVFEGPRSARQVTDPFAPPVGSRRGLVVDTIARVTGHAPGDIVDDMSLEADLGLDSIKRMELLTALANALPESVRDEIAQGQLQQLMQAELVVDLVAIIDAIAGVSSLAEPTRPAAVAPAEPVELLLTEAQYTFLASSVAGVCTCALVSRVRLRGPFDPAIATAAYDDLLDRHPI
jgi:acyl carrier protein